MDSTEMTVKIWLVDQHNFPIANLSQRAVMRYIKGGFSNPNEVAFPQYVGKSIQLGGFRLLSLDNIIIENVLLTDPVKIGGAFTPAQVVFGPWELQWTITPTGGDVNANVHDK